MAIYQKNKIYYIDYYVDGRRVRESAGFSRKAAEALLHKRQVEINEGKYIKKVPKISLQDFIGKYIEFSKAQKRSWERDEITLKHVKKFFDDILITQITSWNIDQYRIERAKHVQKSTVNREIDTVRNFFNKAIEWRYAQNNPVTKDKRFKVSNKRLRYLTPEEAHRLIELCLPYLRPIVQLALATGMRKSEIRNLKWENLNLREGMVHIEHSKSYRRREVPIGPNLTSILRELKLNSRSEWVFSKEDGSPIGNFRKAYQHAVKEAGIKNFTFHDCRHHAASVMVMGGVNLKRVKEILGLASLEMVDRYAHLSPEHRREAAKVVDTYMDTSKNEACQVIGLNTGNNWKMGD